MFGGPKKPYTAITVQVERLTSEQYEENDIAGIVDLVEVIRLQASGPTEAARALRKKLWVHSLAVPHTHFALLPDLKISKYGDVHRQLRALTILDGLLQNAGPRFQRVFVDEPLLERLRVAATDPVSDHDVKAKCKILFGQWAVAYKNTPGLERIAALYKQLPQRKKPQPQQQSKVLRETEVEANNEQPGNSPSLSSIPTASSSSSRTLSLSPGPNLTKAKGPRDKKSKGKPFNLEKEKPQLLQTLASSSVASTNLMNALKLINREDKRVSEDAEVMKRFETCKLLRRQLLRYIQYVESEQWLGSLIHANEELVTALMAFEVLDKSVDDDSDSEDDESDADAQYSTRRAPNAAQKEVQQALAGLSFESDKAPPQPPRPGMSISLPPLMAEKMKSRTTAPVNENDVEEDEEVQDDDDPFADKNAVHTPYVEKSGMVW
ncbi:MAG: hypothetical protein M1819_001789 [Sarea resinae]|nr:MAG: hypothetical protein M1819_001789 [Sarea resinae]